jgi:hypothetical protein
MRAHVGTPRNNGNNFFRSHGELKVVLGISALANQVWRRGETLFVHSSDDWVIYLSLEDQQCFTIMITLFLLLLNILTIDPSITFYFIVWFLLIKLSLFSTSFLSFSCLFWANRLPKREGFFHWVSGSSLSENFCLIKSMVER